jgi:acetyltransferase
MRIIGPNCLGVMSPSELARPSPRAALPGKVAFLSQSSPADRDSRLEFARAGRVQRVRLAVDDRRGWGDLIDYLGDDPSTRAIVIYGTTGDARVPVGGPRWP